MPTEIEEFTDEELEQELDNEVESAVEREVSEDSEFDTEGPIESEEERELVEPGKQAVLDQKGGEPDDWNLEYKGNSGYRFDGENVRDPDGNIWVNEDEALHQEMLAQWSEGGSTNFFLPDYVETTEESETLFITTMILSEKGDLSYEIHSRVTFFPKHEDISAPSPEYGELERDHETVSFEETVESIHVRAESEHQTSAETTGVGLNTEEVGHMNDAAEESPGKADQRLLDLLDMSTLEAEIYGVEEFSRAVEAPLVPEVEQVDAPVLAVESTPGLVVDEILVSPQELTFEQPVTSSAEAIKQVQVSAIVEPVPAPIEMRREDEMQYDRRVTDAFEGNAEREDISDTKEDTPEGVKEVVLPNVSTEPILVVDEVTAISRESIPERFVGEPPAVEGSLVTPTFQEPISLAASNPLRAVTHEPAVTPKTIPEYAEPTEQTLIKQPKQSVLTTDPLLRNNPLREGEGKAERIEKTPDILFDRTYEPIAEPQKAQVILRSLGFAPIRNAESIGLRQAQSDTPVILPPQDTRTIARGRGSIRVTESRGVTMEMTA
jgi:hypothetical protein